MHNYDINVQIAATQADTYKCSEFIDVHLDLANQGSGILILQEVHAIVPCRLHC